MQRTFLRHRSLVTLAAVITLAVLPAVSLQGQTISGSITGTVVDPQSRAVPQASVTATDTGTNTAYTTKTDALGHFVLPSLLPGHYKIDIERTGFQKLEKLDVVLNANTSLPLGTLALQVGAVVQTVQVTAQGEQLQTNTAERGSSIVGTQIENVEINGQSPLFLLKTVPGIYTSSDYSQSNVNFGSLYINGSRSNQADVTQNGADNVDTGSNGSAIVTVSLDSIQEFKVLTSNYDAEYGRSGGAQISMVTKSGTRAFHGSGFEYYRDKSLNANSWTNNRQGLPVAAYHYNDYGFTIGGPIYIPGHFNTQKNKLFFFWSNEWQKQLVPQGQHNVTVPTVLERTGDFSQSVDKNGNPVLIRDPFSGLPCTSSDKSGCFAGNKIPSNLLYQPGVAILNIYPLPNSPGTVNNGYNYISQISDQEPRLEDLIRLDYNLNSKWRFFGSYTINHQDDNSFYGSFVLGANFPIDRIDDHRPSHLLTFDATTTINPTTVNEASFDVGHNLITIAPVTAGALSRTKLGLSNLPTFYTPNDDYIPSFGFNGSRIANSPSFGTSDAPFYNFNTTIEAIDNFSKIWGQHFLKLGIYMQRSRKNQTSFAASSGSYNFGDDASDPLDTGFGFANAALGIFDSFSQASKYATGAYRYTNLEWYAQDTWKVRPRLTLDYGIRLSYIQPQYDASLQTSNFIPSAWSAANAPLLFQPGLNAQGQRVAVNPLNGQTLPPVHIGNLVPGTGNTLNGILQAGHGISKYLMDSKGILPAPRVGLTYDITGHQNLIFRAGYGIFYDRYQGNEIFDEITNPPTTFAPSANYGQVAAVSLNSAFVAPSTLSALNPTGNIPTVYQYSGGIEAKLPWATDLDVSYVGTTSRHLIVRLNLNAIPYGTTFLPQNQDPTKVKANPKAPLGSNAFDSEFVVPYRGYADSINTKEFAGNANYNSLQVGLNRRFAHGLLLGVAYTWSKCMDTDDSDGNFVRIDQYTHEAYYGPCGYNVTNNFAANYVYGLPGIPSSFGAFNNRATRAVLNGWQISGFTQFVSGTPIDPGISISGGIGNQNITGSYTEPDRLVCVGNIYGGTTSSPYNRINSAAFTEPAVGSIGLGCSRNLITGPGTNDWDMSLQKSIAITERVQFQLRIEAFNVFNHTQFSGYESTVDYAGLNNPTVTNLPINSSGQLTRLFGFGAISGVRSPRILQFVVKFVF
ncbi:MAG: carboxypeptidase regulatory-like domain-containing protein [Terriglobia bacterium]